MTYTDYIGIAFFLAIWATFNWLTSVDRRFSRISITRAMAIHRAHWIRTSLTRDLKMIDTAIMAGLQNGTAFFGSASLLALGTSFALLGATDQAETLFHDWPMLFHGGRTAFEIKVCGLSAIFAYSFFKFGWSYRLFNYCSILFGGMPMQQDAIKDMHAANLAAERVIAMNVIAAKHFNAGLRALFLSIGYLGWFVNAYVFMAMTVFVFFVLIRRQFFSEAREAVLKGLEE
jgi:uncharacterized membrane protein